TASGAGAGGAGGAGASGSAGNGGGAGATIVSSKQIQQDWGVGSWTGGTVQITNVQAGDAIFVLGVYWITPKQGAMPAPSDSNGQLSAAVTQAPSYAKPGDYPPVAAQIYYQINAAAGTHTITPPDLVDGGGDGTLYVIQVRDLGASAKLVAAGDSHVLGN